MNQQQELTLAQALASLPGRTREQLSHLTVAAGTPPRLVCHTSAPTEAASGPLAPTPSLEEQIAELTQMGIVGQLATETTDGATRITLWAEDRAAWEARMEGLRAHPHAGADLLDRVAAEKLARARWDRAARSAAERAAAARTGGLSEATVTRLLQSCTRDLAPLEPQRPASSSPQTAGAPSSVGEFVRMPTGHDAPCVTCGNEAWHTLYGQPVHRGECARGLTHGYGASEGQTTAPAHEPPAPEQADPATARRRPRAVRGQQPPTAAKTKGAARQGKRVDRSRFGAAVIAWDGQHLYLPGSDPEPFTGVRHLGQLGDLVTTYRLGHGGGEALPDFGEVLIMPSALDQLELPEEVDRVGLGTREARKRAREEIFDPFTSLGVVQEALAEGWTIGEGRMDARTLVSHPERLPGKGQITIVSWMDWVGSPFFSQDPREGRETLAHPQEIVDRLQEWADRSGGAWKVTPGKTGIDLVDIKRPPTRPGHAPTAGRLVRGERPDLPAFLAPAARAKDSRFAGAGEEVFSWYRPWEKLMDDERNRLVVIAYDHGANFRGPFTSTELPTGDLQIYLGEDAKWDGSETPGYWLVSSPTGWDTPMWNLPNPAEAGGFIVGEHQGHENTRIVTAHTLKQLAILDENLPDTLIYHQAWIWHEHARYLRDVGQALSDLARDGSPAIVTAGKQVYAQMVQKFGSLESPPTQQHLRMPPFRDFIVGAARTSILRTLHNIFTTTGLSPLAVSRDTIFYALDEEDPRAAWPGNPDKYGTEGGKWKPVGVAPLQEWGPICLPAPPPGLGAKLNYERAMKHLTPLDPATGQLLEDGSDQ